MRKVSQFESKECRRVQKLLDHFLAGELAVETNQEILLHLEHCSVCREEENSRMRVRQVLKDSWNSQPVPSDLKEKISGGLVSKSSALPVFLRLVAGLFLLAIALGVLMLLSPSVGEKTGTVMAFDHSPEAAQDHLNCSGQLPPPTAVLPLDPVAVSMQQALKEVDDSYQLIETRLCEVGDVHFVHYAFEGRGRRMSLILEEKSNHQHLVVRGDAPEKVLHGVEVILLQRDSLSLAYLETPNYFVYLISEEREPNQTFQLTEKIIPSLKAAL
ncbi:MAG: anti-sigma factor family protein [Acidobacteriota bacterium]